MTERELAKQTANSLNSFGFNYYEFCEEMGDEHRTLQQSFTRLCLEWMRYCSQYKDFEYDGRNEASVKLCREVCNVLEEKGLGGLPLI